MKRIAAIAAAKGAAVLSRGLRLGGGTALPGLVAERIDPNIVSGLSRGLGQGSLLVTGTNGKTTTARLLRSMVQAGGFRSVANGAGSNLMRGIAAALVESVRLTGGFTARRRCLGIFEVDEATLPQAVASLRPRVLLFTNLFRDQLDRYGEVEHVAAIWREVVQELPDTVTVVLNADDPAVASLAGAAKGRVLLYGLEDAVVGIQGLEHAADARWCPNCGSELSYAAVFFGHLGRWRCSDCGVGRPAVGVACLPSESGTDGQDLTLRLPEGELSARLPLTGLYNAYNALSATAVATVLGVEAEAIEKGLRSFTAGFGRQERLNVGGRQLQVILAKNPAGLNQVLRAITADGAQKDLLLFLNDNIADGQDVSWIWDVDFELLAGATRSLSVSGTRAWDMALRLKYAGMDPLPRVEPDTSKALRMALSETSKGATLYVIPTYTALLDLRRLLARMGERAALWQED